MASTEILTGSELIDCARANSNQGREVAAQRCGYGNDLAAFELALHQAGEHIGVTIRHFEDLLPTVDDKQNSGVVIAPESTSEL
jgi:hypothetical protein